MKNAGFTQSHQLLPLPILEQLWFFLSDFLSFPTARAVPLNSSF
jgi:hypothetical protein